jgi:hypothetical protein
MTLIGNIRQVPRQLTSLSRLGAGVREEPSEAGTPNRLGGHGPEVVGNRGIPAAACAATPLGGKDAAPPGLSREEEQVVVYQRPHTPCEVVA